MRKEWQIKTVDYYIFNEVFKPFIIGVAIIGVIMLSNFLYQLADLIIVKDIPIVKVLQLLFYQLPEIFVQTFPIAVLFSIMNGLGRLSRENEFTALRMGGVSIYRLIVPLIIFAVLISGFTFYINERVVPWSNHQARNIVRLNILKEVAPEIKEDVFFAGPQNRLFYVEEYNDDLDTLSRIVIFNLPPKKEFPEVITAARASITDQNWQLKDGYIHQYDETGHLDIETSFETMEVKINDDIKSFFGEQKTPSEMSRKELKKEINLFQKSGIEIKSLLVAYHLKLAKPFTPLIFVLIGTPLSLGNKDSRALNIVLTIIVIFLYYLILSLSRSFGKNGMLSPLAAAWLPNVIFIFLGLVLLFKKESWENYVVKKLSRLLP